MRPLTGAGVRGRASMLCVLGVGLAACAGPLAQGEAEFKDGQYPDAEQTFASLEQPARTWADSDRAQYALYRGLTLGAVGDTERSVAWLQEAQALERSHPGLLSPDDGRRMKVALEADERAP